MYLSDYHTHCSLSFDSKTPVEDMVRAGIAQGLQEMCLTCLLYTSDAADE